MYCGARQQKESVAMQKRKGEELLPRKHKKESSHLRWVRLLALLVSDKKTRTKPSTSVSNGVKETGKLCVLEKPELLL